jgi:hypothetical protein
MIMLIMNRKLETINGKGEIIATKEENVKKFADVLFPDMSKKKDKKIEKEKKYILNFFKLMKNPSRKVSVHNICMFYYRYFNKTLIYMTLKDIEIIIPGYQILITHIETYIEINTSLNEEELYRLNFILDQLSKRKIFYNRFFKELNQLELNKSYTDNEKRSKNEEILFRYFDELKEIELDQQSKEEEIYKKYKIHIAKIRRNK